MAGFDLERELGLFLATSRTATLATAAGDGTPHAACVQYAHGPGLRLTWVSSPRSLHSRHLAENPQAAVTVYGHDDRAENIHGVQMRGRATPITDPARWNEAWELYTTKYAFIKALPQYREAVESQMFYAFKPSWVRWIDNRRGFGWKVEQMLGG